MITRYGLILVTCLFLLGACNNKQQEKDSQLALIKTTNPTPLMTDKTKKNHKVNEIKEVVSTFPELYDIAVVKGKGDTLVAYKVKHLHRFKMKKIEKGVTKKLKKKFPKEEFTVSSDYKIFLETVRLDEKMHSKNFSKHDAEKRFKEIVKMTEDIK
ncbi:YhcN/YlaJ family sporulation lipoprotein [Neobacillus sp. MM2021_6]|uniref:YhcN/YlaJ family sporulation lipoprotein n=1 Tax=Bacillaceae TaxID=186817 RepID=UPI001409AE6C|nr:MULTISPECIES: YhcN/YlaJ family sporulation lipoprotein [Bacillaceae]MBO0962593.1 YhcN/YlaJ family sporulation lipoprotein [Neobacillus sp. MM2021_6]NHC16681.1 sporulation protein [Bacillus sp. MM2020_4]WML38814.1 YhcN/YlaJ family sporulation lipoprotein [Neobacillus sp. OS1-2]